MYAIFIPRTQLTSIFEGQPLKTRPFPTKTRVSKGHLGSRYLHLIPYMWWIPDSEMAINRRPFFWGAKTWHSSYRTAGGQAPITWCVWSQPGRKRWTTWSSHITEESWKWQWVKSSRQSAIEESVLDFCFIAKFLPAPSSRGGKWLRVKGATSPSLRVELAPRLEGAGRCLFFQRFLFWKFTPTCENDPIWRAYFSDGLKPSSPLPKQLLKMMFLFQRWDTVCVSSPEGNKRSWGHFGGGFGFWLTKYPLDKKRCCRSMGCCNWVGLQ